MDNGPVKPTPGPSASNVPSEVARDEPVDVLSYLWSLRRFLPVGLVVAAAVGAAMVLPNRSAADQRSAVSVQTNVLVSVPASGPAGSTMDAAAAATTYAALAQNPKVLGAVDVPGADTPELLRGRVDVYSLGTVIVLKVNGLGAEDATTVAKTIGERVTVLPTEFPIRVGGEPAVLVPQVPYEVPGSVVTRSLIQSYVLAALVAGVAGLASMFALGWWVRRRR